ncbi:hypothetical protein ACR8AL_13405 [Clavibacter sepedonicus]|uniref:Uncharacterized protein n=1 Tax=Clavibacter sepedonicus TaxID=31964 RepID=B0RGE1_CLASE|nr:MULTISPECIES: hypothetical protein [Clavibacter]MBD5382126.1 hypothetical protein [Clavibacter sp.]OQJ46946.1 hypothetical protein B5P19_00605 [Clavibacter sepedonicus]OQJ55132.1 hypothetical protein B5P20_14290 [Clavibacter sepedonicus]UUK66474.1 hypothetical protein LRE50_04445 [Clavibacter sepedonicus]CAQ01197.1 hypothetical protein CMS1083 [Clavibacter sepedonicus]
MRRGRDGLEGERGSAETHAIGVGAVVVILDGAAATGDPALDGEPVGLVVASASDGLRSVSPVPTARGRAWVVELGSDDDGAAGRRVVVPQSALRLVDDADETVSALPADDLPPRA